LVGKGEKDTLKKTKNTRRSRRGWYTRSMGHDAPPTWLAFQVPAPV
jgi:hypothetical protein